MMSGGYSTAAAREAVAAHSGDDLVAFFFQQVHQPVAKDHPVFGEDDAHARFSVCRP
ncbi:hypothetical protein ACFXJ5_08725 [Streptomyces sp. NPDC059373]